MLPACRKNGDVYRIPECQITIPDVEGFVAELKNFHAQFTECFVRSEPRENF